MKKTNYFSQANNSTKEQKKNILLNLNKKSNKIEDCKTEMEKKENGGHKFKRLQQKWEKLSGKTGIFVNK